MSNSIPHLVFTADGNRRAAVQHGQSFEEGYERTARHLVNIVEWALVDNPVDELTIFICAEYNLNREPKSLDPMVRAVTNGAVYICESDTIANNGIRFNIVGELDSVFRVYPEAEGLLSKAVKKAAGNTGKQVNYLFGYNGHKSLERAVRECLKKEEALSYDNFMSHMPLKTPISCLIRTGEPQSMIRLSEYFPGIEQARLFSTPTLFPDLTKAEFDTLIQRYFTLVDRYVPTYTHGQK